MLRNYFKTAWRNLAKNKFYSFINIAGLSAGLCVGMLILLWVQDEYSFDNFHSKAKDIYRLENRVGTGNSTQIWSSTVAPIAKLSKQQLPEVKDYVRLTENYFYSAFRNGDKIFNDNTLLADPQFFTFFDFPLIRGNKANPFPNTNSVVMTETTAKKYFGTEDAIGKTIIADNRESFMVTGVIKDFPKNSSMQAAMVFPLEMITQKQYAGKTGKETIDHDFHQFNYNTYLQLQPGVNTNALATKIRNIHLANKADDTDILYLVQALKDMHLYHADGTAGGIETVRTFTIVALLILVIACINYVNLSTARSLLRAKEVSMRKIVGAARVQLFTQFIVETGLLFILASIFAIGLMYIALPVFNDVSGKELEINLGDYHLWLVILATIVGSLIASSIYPALMLSSFKPLKALRGGKASTNTGDAGFRKVLVVTQFAFSVMLITGTMVIKNQLDYIRSKELGFDKTHTLHVGMGEMGDHYEAVKAELLKQPGVQAVARASSDPVQIGGETGSNDWNGKQKGQTLMLHPMSIDKDFIPFFKMQLVQGSNFTDAAADSMHFILNETAIRETGIKDPIGKPFKLWDTWGTITGVVKDFHFASMKEKIAPAIFYYNPSRDYQLFVKTTGQDAPKAIAAVEKQFKNYNAGFPFSYVFLDETFDQLYRGETRTGTLFNAFAAIAIFISCLGLFGLAAYTAQVRTREIGVRKVLGASVSGIVKLLAADFVKLVLIAIVIATPIAWYAMDKWLQGFAYQVNIGWIVFVLAGVIAIGIAFFTIAFQSIKAALANPVKSLRTE